jgi:GNAT superfamily N-acetyltransferase
MTQKILRDLGDGLILRRSTPADAEALADFCGRIHSDDGPDQPDAHIAAWTRDLVARPHPTFQPDDFTVVAEAATGRIVSTLNMIPQTWAYEGVPFGVGRPELVGTLPEYRNRGLIRLQFEEIHKWSAARGDLVQAITGIPFYYRLFGYEMTMDLGGRRFGYGPNVPKLKEGEAEPYPIRRAAEADLPFVAQVYEQAFARYEVVCQRTPEIWKYELDGQSFDNADHYEIMIIEDAQGKPVGYFQHPTFLGITGISVQGYELCPGVSWLDVTPSVARYLWQRGQEYAKRDGKECSMFGFMLGLSHPAYEAFTDSLPGVRKPYAWYIRVPDLPAFIRHIKPVLEKRLAESIAVGYSGELKISFYRDGLRMVFEKGQLQTVESWKPKPEDKESAAFPGLTFLQIVFGYRSFDELHYAFVDCYWDTNEARRLLEILFPKKLSDVLPVA